MQFTGTHELVEGQWVQIDRITRPTKRKPHSDFAGYVAELRNKYSGGHTVISDCKRAAEEGSALVENYTEEGGRYQVLCNEHGHLVYCTNLPVARECVKDPTTFCMVCRCIAGEAGPDWEHSAGLVSEEVVTVWTRIKLLSGEFGDKHARKGS